ncbi:hypothetical protein [Mucilaginibacter sp. PPCGB 2223]|uniref:hypothetical protein n=1 Tax=Mucilaginibacter sp. PPCGB 2223 TaxID=1886027 RepID=UPI0011127503|nr:hypothetical protein [Mucilaginibacter sp. PPCGB 2223]
MKKRLTFSFIYCILSLFLFGAILSSCEKIPGHTIGTGTGTGTSTGTGSGTKQGVVSFKINDTTHILQTTAFDTVKFNVTTAPKTTITAQNGQKYLSAYLEWNSNTTGTFAITNAAFSYILADNQTVLITSTTSGTVTVNSLNASGGVLTGTFSCPIKDAKNTTVTATGTFNIQQ